MWRLDLWFDFMNLKEIIEAINNLKNHKTLISISHKKTTMLYCDEIYEIKNSKLIKKDV